MRGRAGGVGRNRFPKKHAVHLGDSHGNGGRTLCGDVPANSRLAQNLRARGRRGDFGADSPVRVAKSEKKGDALHGSRRNRQRIHSRAPQPAPKPRGNYNDRLWRVDRPRRPSRPDCDGVRVALRAQDERAPAEAQTSDCVRRRGRHVGGFPHAACGRAFRLRNRNRGDVDRHSRAAACVELRKLHYDYDDFKPRAALRNIPRVPLAGSVDCVLRAAVGNFVVAACKDVACDAKRRKKKPQRQSILAARPSRAGGDYCWERLDLLPRSRRKRCAHNKGHCLDGFFGEADFGVHGAENFVRCAVLRNGRGRRGADAEPYNRQHFRLPFRKRARVGGRAAFARRGDRRRSSRLRRRLRLRRLCSCSNLRSREE